MTDKIAVNTDALGKWASQLDSVSDNLADVAKMLGRIDTSEDWWRRVNYSTSFRLRDEDSRQSMSNFRSAVSEWSGALKRYDSRVQSLAKDVRTASSNFENAEKGVSSAISDLLGGSNTSTGATNTQGGSSTDFDWGSVFKKALDKTIDTLLGPAKWLGGKIADAAAFWYNDYKQKGTTYKVLKTGGAVLKIIGSGAAIVAAWAGTGLLTAGTAGAGATVSVPLATLITMYGANTIANSFTDIANCWNGNVDQVGEVNYLKDICKKGYGEVGELLGNREAGEKFGEGLYTVGEVTTLIANVTNAFKDVHSAVEKAGSVKEFVSQTMNSADDFWHLISKVDVKDLNYQSTLFKYANPTFVENVKNIKDVVKDSLDIGKNFIEFFAH